MKKQPEIFILSPHIDDAAFSLALTISKLIDNCIPITIINCFTVTRWTGVFVSRDIEVVSKVRKAEDAAFNELFNSLINIINLDLLDAPLRNGYIFQHQPFQPDELQLIDDLTSLLEPFDGILLCPLALGSHIDHAVCNQAAQKHYHKREIVFYEDLPYARRVGEEQIDLLTRSLQKQLRVALTSYINPGGTSTIDKEQAIRVYKSQLNDEIISEIIAHKNALGGERLWGEEKVLEELKCLL